MEFSDDLSLKNQMQLLKSKWRREKKQANFKPGGGAQAAELQMERLCRVTGQIENMKRVLSRLKNKTCNSDEAPSHEQHVIYVPIAELREKLWYRIFDYAQHCVRASMVREETWDCIKSLFYFLWICFNIWYVYIYISLFLLAHMSSVLLFCL